MADPRIRKSEEIAMKKQTAKTSTTDNLVPAWAILTKAESRNLYKPEPARKGLRGDEDVLLRMFRKLGRSQRMQVFLLANGLALVRVRERLAAGKRGKKIEG